MHAARFINYVSAIMLLRTKFIVQDYFFPVYVKVNILTLVANHALVDHVSEAEYTEDIDVSLSVRQLGEYLHSTLHSGYQSTRAT